MGKITGTGCQLSGMMTAFITANPEHKLEAAAAAVCTMGLAGEIGWSRMQPGDGNASYRVKIIDAIYHMDGKTLEEGAKIALITAIPQIPVCASCITFSFPIPPIAITGI